ncbi:hypothetical protein Pint_30329 [Pistacia integerrima]|uniref:Uncharacterized protein n=1 Tax=Pistacia integerrima TaxID=434235 RepID=A0ACC0X1D4_9ROSI|nr:hypothetical protein Pint_30329 [Pistacia integerrima]
MGSPRRDVDLEEQLKEVGNALLSPPSAIDELTALLDKAEHLLTNVEQAPPGSMQDALLPSMKALIADELLRHSDTDVRLSVASCISEITRITAPEAPYDDDIMKEIFHLSVAAFEKLSHVSGRCYTKAVSVLDTVAKVRSCLVMLDLECDTLIIEMFQHFLKFIRSNHPHAVFSSMETIMTLVIDESEDISWDLLSVLLSSVRKENQDVSPISWKLGEKVITNCAAKLKSSFMDALQSRGIALDQYAEIVSYICKNEYETLQGLDCSGKYLATNKLDPVSPGEVCHDVDDISKSMKCNGTSPTRDDKYIDNRSSKVFEQCTHADHSRNIDVRGSAKPDNLVSVRNVKSDTEPASAPKKRGRKPNSLMNPEEGYDHSWICTGRKNSKVPGREKSHDKEFDCSPSVDPDFKKRALLSTEKNVGEPASSPTPKSHLNEESHPRRGRPKKKQSMKDQDGDLDSLSVRLTKSTNSILKKEPENRHEKEVKRHKLSLEGELAAKASEETAAASGCGVSEKEADIPNDLEEKPQKLSATKARGEGVNEDKPSVKTDVKKGSLVAATSAKGITDASGTKVWNKKSFILLKSLLLVKPLFWYKLSHYLPSLSTMKKGKISKAAGKSSNRNGNNSVETPNTEVKRKHTAGKEVKKNTASKSSNRDRNYSEETPKTKIKRKHTAGEEVAFETHELGEQLVGKRIKVWWPMDKTFYEGVIDSYDRIKKKHRILYVDGDVERLNLEKQRFKLIEDVDLSKGGQETDVLKPDASSAILQKEKDETKFQLVKEVKASSLKRIRWFSMSSEHAIASKAKARKSAGASAGGAKLDKPIIGDEPIIDASEKDSSSKGDGHNSINKLIVRDRKLILTVTRRQQTYTSPSKGGGESPGMCRSGDDFNNSKEAKNVEFSTNMEANEIGDIDQVIEGGGA